MINWTPMSKVLPPVKLAEAEVTHFEITKQQADFTALLAVLNGRPGERVLAGKYARLFVKGTLMMSDTQNEQQTNSRFVHFAKGDVLVAGLGLGMVLLPVLAKKEVASVTVLEKTQDVIDAVLPSLRKAMPAKHAAKLTVLCADVFEWQPPKGASWDVIYFDIWPSISLDNLTEIATLKRRFAKRLRREPFGWMGAWVEDELRYQQARARAGGY